MRRAAWRQVPPSWQMHFPPLPAASERLPPQTSTLWTASTPAQSPAPSQRDGHHPRCANASLRAPHPPAGTAGTGSRAAPQVQVRAPPAAGVGGVRRLPPRPQGGVRAPAPGRRRGRAGAAAPPLRQKDVRAPPAAAQERVPRLPQAQVRAPPPAAPAERGRTSVCPLSEKNTCSTGFNFRPTPRHTLSLGIAPPLPPPPISSSSALFPLRPRPF